MHNPATAFFTAEDKQRHPYLSSVLEPSTQKVIATAAVRVYYAPFINPHVNWSYSKLKGILVFGRDREGVPDAPPPDRGTHGLRLKEKYWFRLVDVKTDRVVWMFSVPEVFEYKKDKPFFHYFSGSTRMFGFCFDEDEEAGVFHKKVIDRTRRHSVFRPFRSGSVKKEKTKAPQSPPVKRSMISSPTPHSFVHVSHVGISTKGIIESSKNIEPAWGALIADLQGYGISPEVVKENTDFMEGFLAGAKTMRDKVAGAAESAVSPAPAPVPTSPPEKKRNIRRKVTIL
ncbi:hypothetical protein HYDPIDRAFT_167598 [Hydnomerulius pinastri MD-312]|uniref:WH1 domain-containing protein n=1 Tax=Hydnomerulius pinastri MD-312 TaxID=994086 RepID=A0A0C9WA66_9AGAM|nr:hypothetical protein HYDPIDRAFT_167598 [Hydnomerulius pinastri MD-312]